MPDQQYSVNDYSVGNLLNWIQTKEIAIPEIQRPFVWQATKVRDFIDSLYRGYPVGYLITWKAPDVRLKDGTQSIGQRILIDGQQRVISLEAALLGKKVVKKITSKSELLLHFIQLRNVLKYPTLLSKRMKDGFLIFQFCLIQTLKFFTT